MIDRGTESPLIIRLQPRSLIITGDSIMPSVKYSVFITCLADPLEYKGESAFIGSIEKVTEWLKQLPVDTVVEIVVIDSKE